MRLSLNNLVSCEVTDSQLPVSLPDSVRLRSSSDCGLPSDLPDRLAAMR